MRWEDNPGCNGSFSQGEERRCNEISIFEVTEVVKSGSLNY